MVCDSAHSVQVWQVWEAEAFFWAGTESGEPCVIFHMFTFPCGVGCPSSSGGSPVPLNLEGRLREALKVSNFCVDKG
jgi:hypothetical protein